MDRYYTSICAHANNIGKLKLGHQCWPQIAGNQSSGKNYSIECQGMSCN